MNYIDIIKEKIFPDYIAFSEVLNRWKSSGDKVIFTNGCFDLVHRGHIDSLAKAANLGDRLIVGLNSDDSVARLKGIGRPLIDEESRAFLLASIFFVDAVVIFTEDTPEGLISDVLPDILVKGSDYAIHEIAGHEVVMANGGKVVTIDIVPGYSTSDILERIRLQQP
jgi:D-glycero-beta-D-manno-heptose 1-phosphate adenylyltransferase